MKKKIITIIIVLLLAGAGAAYAFGLFDKEEEKPARSQLTGLGVDSEAAERPVLAVMIENSQEARPQTGLDSAGIVFEATTEGGITRYLALYQESMPEEIGPVRSLRVNFLDWLTGFDASAAHVGGSERALDLADNRDAKSLNQFKYDEPYYRKDSRQAPHNMYARTDDLRELQEELEHRKSRFSGIPRSDDAPNPSPQATEITLNYSGPLYRAQFRYDQPSNSYTRYLASDPHLDEATGQSVTVKNLVVLQMDADNNAQEGSIGSGDALVFKDGNATQARWQLSGFSERIKIIDAQGAELPLNRGDTWFAALPEGREPSY